MRNYPTVSKIYKINEENFIAVDQQSVSDYDETCLCFARIKDGQMIVERIDYIEKQHDMDKYINENLEKIYGVFGISNLNDK